MLSSQLLLYFRGQNSYLGVSLGDEITKRKNLPMTGLPPSRYLGNVIMRAPVLVVS